MLQSSKNSNFALFLMPLDSRVQNVSHLGAQYITLAHGFREAWEKWTNESNEDTYLG